MANSSSPWSAYFTLMDCRLVALDKSPGMSPVGIGKTIHQVLAKIVMRAAGNQVKTDCGNLLLCAGIESGIEGETQDMGGRRR